MRLFIYEFISAGGLGEDAPSSLRREGGAMLSSLLADFAKVPGIKIRTQLLEGSSNLLPDRSIEVIACSAETEYGSFVEGLKGADASLILAPEFDGFLESRTRLAEEQGCIVLGCSPKAIHLTADKWALASHWAERGVPTPTTFLCPLASSERIGFPRVLKPRYGAGSMATFLIHDESEWKKTLRRATLESPGEMILQKFVPGTSASVAFLMGPNQVQPLLPTRQMLSDDGRFQYLGGEIPLPRPLAERAKSLGLQAVAGIDGLMGYVGVDLILADDPDQDVVLEINPRLATSYVGLRTLFKGNLADAWLRLHQGASFEAWSWKPEKIRFWADGTLETDASPHKSNSHLNET